MLDQSGTLTTETTLPACRRPDFFLARLHRLVMLDWDPDLDAQERRLVRRAIYSSFMDCRALGAGDEAREILARAPGLPGD